MGCRLFPASSSPEEKLLFYEKFISRSRFNSPISHKEDLDNNPKAWNSFVIERLHRFDSKNLWQSYTGELVKFLEEKPLEQYVRPINSKSWLSLLGIMAFL